MSFNEHTLRTEIAATWGEYGAHIDVYDMLLARLHALDAFVKQQNEYSVTSAVRHQLEQHS